MSKMSIVRQSLESNPNIILVYVKEDKLDPDRGDWSQTFDFIVAPNKGLYTAKQLQHFMMSLRPKGLKPTIIDTFSQYDKLGISCGRLYFDEIIGQKRMIEIEISRFTDEEVLSDSKKLSKLGYESGVKIVTRDDTSLLQRRAWISPYPSEAYARDMLRQLKKGKQDMYFSITPENLEKYQKLEERLK